MKSGNDQAAKAWYALWDLVWHGSTVTISIRGTHINYDEVSMGEHSVQSPDIEEKVIAWAEAIKNRPPNTPIPPPP